MRLLETPPMQRPDRDRAAAGRRASERGAILIQTVIAMIGLTAFSAFVVDYGVLWSARRQAQNSADAAAIAAASYLGYTDPSDVNGARTAAIDAAAQNRVWGEAPDIGAADVAVVPCPSNAPGYGTPGLTCVRADVYRNQRPGGSPLPSIFGSLVGIANQGVKATATAQILYGNSSDHVRPFAIPDKWEEHNELPGGWDLSKNYAGPSGPPPVPMPPDVYTPPVGTTDNGTGFDMSVDNGLMLIVKANDGTLHAKPGYYSPVAIDCAGLACHEAAIISGSSTVVGPGSVLGIDSGGGIHPSETKRVIEEQLIARDSAAMWDPAANNGRGGISGGCMAAATCTISPRVIAVPVYDPDVWDQGLAAGGAGTVTITRVVGMFVDLNPAGELIGYLMPYPSTAYDGVGGQPRSAFVVNVILVR